MPTPDTTPEAVAERVGVWRTHTTNPDALAGAWLLDDACDLIDELTAERDAAGYVPDGRCASCHCVVPPGDVACGECESYAIDSIRPAADNAARGYELPTDCDRCERPLSDTERAFEDTTCAACRRPQIHHVVNPPRPAPNP